MQIQWLSLAIAGSISLIGWFVSMFHYTVATEPGGKHLFALIIATVVVSIIRYNSLKTKNV